MKLLTAAGERSYTLEDTVRLSPEGSGTRLADYQIGITHSDARLTGSRAILKGNVHIAALYLTGEGGLAAGTAELPFSQYIDLGECRETDELVLETNLMGSEVELSADGGGLNVTLQLCSQAQVWSGREPELVRDLYTLDGQAVPEWEEMTCESLLDRQYFAPVGHGTVNLPGDQALYLSCQPGEISHSRSGDTAEFTLPVKVQAVSTEGQAESCRVNLTCSTQAAPGCRFEVRAEELTASAAPGASSTDITVRGTVCVRTYGSQQVRCLAGCELQEAEPERDGPGLIIRRPGERERLWDIAKQYRTTVSAIAAANSLTGEPGTDALLLIPRGSGKEVACGKHL